MARPNLGDLGLSLALDNGINLYILQYISKVDEYLGIELAIPNVTTC